MNATSPPKTYVCRHILVELNGCPAHKLNDAALLEALLLEAAQLVDTQVQAKVTHCFEHQGVTSVAIVSASHLSVHTWPEYGYAGLDLMVYDTDFQICDVVDQLAARVAATSINYMEVRRGLLTCSEPAVR